MGLGTNDIIKTDVTGFIPQLWSDEVVAAYKVNLVMANLVRTMNHRGKKGDTVNIPAPTRGKSSDKAANTQVTLVPATNSLTANNIQVLINKHREYSILIEDLVDVQAIESLRRFYTDDAGYAIAKRVDRQLILEACAGAAGISVTGGTIVEDATTGNIDSTSTFTNAIIGDGATAWDPTANTNAGNAVDLTDAGIRLFIKRLDDADAPMSGRYLVVPTVTKQDMLGFSRYTENAFVGEQARANSIRTGLVGDVYGVEVYVTTNLLKVEDAGAGVDQSLALMFQRDALVLIEQLGIRTQEQYKQEYLASLFTADMIFGAKTLRATGINAIVVPSTAT